MIFWRTSRQLPESRQSPCWKWRERLPAVKLLLDESLPVRRPGGRQSRRLKYGSTNRGRQLDPVKVLRRVQVILARFIDDTE
jgi:hypothetical protein